MWLWGRITLCDGDEIDEKTTLDRLRLPLSEKTEAEAPDIYAEIYAEIGSAGPPRPAIIRL